MKKDKRDFYHSKKWKLKRKSIMRRDGYMSQEAKRFGKRIPGDIVHHIFPRDIFPEYELADWNLITVTADEHNKIHDRMTGDLTQKGMELLERTARKRGMDLEQIRERMAEASRALQM